MFPVLFELLSAVDSSGNNSYQTNDSNANPNGTRMGNWTRQQQVHGDGSK